MKKHLYSFTILLSVLGALEGKSQGGVYFREGFEPNTGWPSSSANAIPFQEVNTANSGKFYTFGSFVTPGPTGSCTIQTGGPNHLRFGNLTSVLPGFTTADSSFILTPEAPAGIFNISFFNGRASRRFTILKTTDTDPNTTNWVEVAFLPNTNAACDFFTVAVNDASARRLKIMARSGTDSDIDSLVMTSVGVLPTRFGTISVQQRFEDVIATWNAYNESNVRGYYLQRSSDGSSFADVAFTPAQNALEATYTATDKIKGGGMFFYRLKGVDYDGKTTYSPITKIMVDRGAANGVLVRNPVRGNRVEIQLSGLNPGTYQIAVNGISGNRITARSVQVQQGNMSVSLDLPAGTAAGMQVLTVTGNNFRHTQKIVVD